MRADGGKVVEERGLSRVGWWRWRELGSGAAGRKSDHVVAIAIRKRRSFKNGRGDVPERKFQVERGIKNDGGPGESRSAVSGVFW
jgi:hypothetical protein